MIRPSITLPAATGVFTLSVQVTGIGQFVDFAEGSFTITGQDAAIRVGRERRVEFADAANSVALFRDGPNAVILDQDKNEAA